MNRQEKSQVVQMLGEDLEVSKAVFLVAYKGLAVEQLQALRKGLRGAQGTLKIAKARLMKRAAIQASVDQLSPLLKDQIGLVFARNEVASVAKILRDFAKNNEHLKLVGGVLGRSLLDAVSVDRLAQLPSREVLLAQLLGVMNAPVSNLVRLLNLLIVRLLLVLKAIEGIKSQQV